MKNKPLWQIGLALFILGGLLNTVLIKAGIGGIPRELSRFSVLAGVVLLIIALIKKRN